MIVFKPYDSGSKDFGENIPFKIPEKVESVSFSYDGGRVSLYINGKEVFYSAFGGNSFDIDIDNKNQ